MFNILNYYDIITFDVFDTLLERDVKVPADIFTLTAEKVLEKGRAKEFRIQRINAEKNAREKRLDGEVTIFEIYDELRPIYGEKTNVLLNMEIYQEKIHCRKRNKYAEYLGKCIKEKKKVFLISDMYLPSEIILQMLNKCGIQGFDKIYVSGEYRKNKASGKLFEIVVFENRLNKNQMIHIGDSIRSDFVGAHRAGINCVLIRSKGKLKRNIFSRMRKIFLSYN